jgi:cholesterol oxidase
MTIDTKADTRRTRSLSKGFVDLIVELREKPDTVFDVIIVGSGYGGSVAAQQLAGLRKPDGTPDGAPLRIAVLERGSEYLPGMFPSAFADLPKHVRYARQSTGKVSGDMEGLYDLRLGDDVNALVANGLGGGSLINAGVMIKPDFTSFRSALPANLITDLTATGGYLDRAKALLIDQPLALKEEKPPRSTNTIQHHTYNTDPQNCFPLKFKRLEELATGGKQLDPSAKFEAAEISVAMQDVQANEYGIKLNACAACGDCMTGCNVGAKASLNTNLLAQAKRDGVEIYTGASVLSLRRMTEVKDAIFDAPGTVKIWELDVVHTSLALRKRMPAKQKDGPTDHPALRARHVILAAGTFGSTEILMRSRSATVGFSNTLGERFSCNGDNIAAIHDLPEGKNAHCTDDEFKGIRCRGVGPTITGTIKVPKKDDFHLGYLIQEFAIPAPLKRLYDELVTTAKVVADLPKKEENKSPRGSKDPNDLDPCAVNPDAMERTLMLGIIGHDDAKGVMRLPLAKHGQEEIRNDQEGILQVVWSQAREGQQLESAFDRLTEYSQKAFHDATVISNPMWKFLPKSIDAIIAQKRGPVLTVHPLGGCAIGEDVNTGVVNDFCVVHDACKQHDASQNLISWEGTLMVLDGSVIPGSLGANPSLTISAIALRAITAFIDSQVAVNNYQRRQKSSTEKLSDDIIFDVAKPQVCFTPTPTEVRVTERLSGEVVLPNESGNHERYILELTLDYEQNDLVKLMSTWGGHTQKVVGDSYVRLFRQADWVSGKLLHIADEKLLEKNAIWKAALDGNLKFFQKEKKQPFAGFKAFLAYLRNRGIRDIYQAIIKWFKKSKIKNLSIEALVNAIKSLWNFCIVFERVLTRASEVRTFNYDLQVDAIHKSDPNFDSIFAKQVIQGVKRLTYNCRANPWEQMLEMTLTKFPLLDFNKKSKLKVDGRFLANQDIPLAEISKQANQVNALLDMASFGLFMSRIIINNHLLSFRMPDALLHPHQPNRLPQKINGLPEPEITKLLVSKSDPVYDRPDAIVRLTRYKGSNEKHHPVAFIHGYSANGATFVHPSLKPSIAEYLWKSINSDVGERDIWIIDLRSSSGMPTATVPWSYEEIALVDIPAALLHIKAVTGKKVDVVAHCVGAAMLSMAILTKAEDVRNDAVELGVSTYIQDAQLGILNAFNGDGLFINDQPRAEHPTINAIVMSQKGPLIRYTEENIFRAYVMKFLQRWLAPEGYAFRQSDSPTAGEQLIDRFLTTLPYPDEEYDRENPICPWARTEWTTSRHRMDALYGRAFNAANMSDETLNCIDDFFGSMSMETLTQIIQFVQFSCITNQRGRGEFVSLQNLKTRWIGIPTLSIHGEKNGMVDPATKDLIQVNFEAAGIPYTNKSYSEHGHQDLFIGNSCECIFEHIEVFLNNPKAYIAKNPPPASKAEAPKPIVPLKAWHIDTPWIGPRLHADMYGNPSVSVMSSPKYGKGRLVLFPVQCNIQNGRKTYTRNGTINANLNRIAYESKCWDGNMIIQPRANKNQSWLALSLYESEQTFINPANVDGANFQIQTLPLGAILQQASLDATIDGWLLNPPKNIDHCFISAADIEHWQKSHKESFNFALSSCQFPPGIMDIKVSESSMKVLANLVDKNKKNRHDFIDFVIFAGDQIYADATAGLADPTRRDTRLEQPYNTALRTDSMQKIMSKVPVHMLLDDHEIIDNWEPTESPDNPPLSSAERRKANKNLLDGVEAYWRYQRLYVQQNHLPFLTPRKQILKKEISYAFDHGCTAFYMLDTRSKRQYRKIGDPASAALWTAPIIPYRYELDQLCTWLVDNKDKVKFIVTPSILLPRKLAALSKDLDHPSREDSWTGYPSMMHTIFLCILDNDIKNTVFLSGDEHLCCYATIELRSKNHAHISKIASVHASGLYSPFPFANGKIEDFVQGKDTFNLKDISCIVTAHYFDDMNFAKICVNQPPLVFPSVVVEYHSATGTTRSTPNLL